VPARWRTIAALTLLGLCALPATASAGWRLERAQAVAAKAWNDPCPGRVRIAFVAPPAPTWLAWSIPALCQVNLSNATHWRWRLLCPSLLHEYGHLAGYRDPLNPSDPTHSHDPDDIMAPFIHWDARCADHGSTYLGYTRASAWGRSADYPVRLTPT
jgi:hypothetical protein